MKNVKAVLFDVGGTLITYPSMTHLGVVCQKGLQNPFLFGEDVILRAYELYEARRRESFVTLQETEFGECLLDASEEIYPAPDDELGELLTPIKVSKIVLTEQALFCAFSDGIQLFPGTRKLLDYLKEKQLRIGLVSNTPFSSHLHMVDLYQLGILSYFKVRVWSVDEGVRKPHVRIFDAAARSLEVYNNEIAFVGDSFDRDIVGAAGAGMTPIWVNRKNEHQPDYDGRQVGHLEEIIPLLENE